MKNIKKVLIILFILLIIVSIIIIGTIIYKKHIEKKLMPKDADYVYVMDEHLKKVTSRNNYYAVKEIVEKYYSNLCNLNKISEKFKEADYGEGAKKLKEQTVQKIYSSFEEKTIKEMELSTNNIQEKLGTYNDLYVLIEDIYVRDIQENIKIYFVFGTLTEKDTEEAEKFQLMIAIDSKNKTFNIYTSEYIQKHNLYELSKKEDFNNKDFEIINIEKRKYNLYEYKIISDEIYIEDLLKNITQSIKYNNIDYLYSKLEEQYKTKKFQDKSCYEEFIKEHRNDIIKATLTYYKSNRQDGYTQYIAVDQNENYYIFNEISSMNCTIILDIYTIDIPEFVEEYNNSQDNEKVQLNIQKVVTATKDGDYKYVYNKLDSTFKSSNFATQADFEKYIKERYKEEDKIAFTTYEKINDVHIYGLEITKGDGNVVKAQVVMQLKEGTDFAMSFSAVK